MARPSSSSGREVARVAERVQSLVAQGLDVVEAYAAARASSPARELARIEKEQAQAAAAHERAVTRHTTKVASRRRNVVTLAATSGTTAVLGVVDMVSDGWQALPGEPWMWFGAAGLSAVLAVRTKWSADHAEPPAAPAAVPTRVSLDARALRRDAVGWPEAQGLLAVRRQVVTMVPAVSALHEDAGRELEQADRDAGPVLGALVGRLVLLDQVVRDLPGTGAATAAATAAGQVRERLADGVRHYDELLSAAARLLAAPDLGRGTAQVLGPAADALTAYAAGLRTAADG